MIRKTAITLLFVCCIRIPFVANPLSPVLGAAGDDQIYTAEVPPLVMLVMGRSHKLYYEAYNDASDLNGDGELDVGYNPAIDYYGYFDCYKCYAYNNTEKRFEPSSTTADKTCSGEWSGDYLNYLTMSRIDCLRKVLYGGYRSTDTATETVLERAFIPQDAHSWGKEYTDPGTDAYDIGEYTPFAVPNPGTRHLFASTTMVSENDPPLLRVLTDVPYRIWEWVSIQRPVAGNKVVHGETGPTVSPIDHVVRVVVADPSMPETNCKQYPSGVYKPIGILQQYGESGRMYFGLLTGSYTKNTSGGVLRKKIGPLGDEIDPSTGRFTSTNGIIKTIDKLRISKYNYSGYYYEPGWSNAWLADRAMTEGEFPDWGNPTAEMMYEGLRYFAGKEAPTSAFDYGSGPSVDQDLELPKPDWDDPYTTNDYCAKAFMLVLTDINPTYDSDQLPGSNSNFGFFTGDLGGLDVENLADTICANEGDAGSHYIGQQGSMYDGSCSPKDVTSFGDIRGLCPEEPTKQGSYYAASVAYFGRTEDMHSADTEQNVLCYIVALASPLPRITIPVGDSTITMVPFAKSVSEDSACLAGDILPGKGNFQPTNTIVDFYVEEITSTYGKFRINYEDVEQAADHDMDAIVEYEYQVVASNGSPVDNPANGTGVKITLDSICAAECVVQHLGYIISGTTADGTYLEVRDLDTAEESDVDYFLDTPTSPLSPSGTDVNWNDGEPLPLTHTRTFTVGTTAAATLLTGPLWYAAKWGGFNDLNNNGKPDLQGEWDEDGDDVPDTYFYVVNPLRLEEQLNQSFADILSRAVSHITPVVSVDEASRTQSGNSIYTAYFRPRDGDYWQGNLKKYGLANLPRTDCARIEPEWTVVDKNGKIAVACDGVLKAGSTSYWSSAPDGAQVNKGGAGELLKQSMPGSDPVEVPSSGPYYDFRTIGFYDEADEIIKPFIKEHVTNSHLDVTDDLTRYKIINFMYGYTFDALPNGDPVAKRPWILGDIIHSEPFLIDYFDSNGQLEFRFVAVGANDGILHVFTDKDIPSLGGRTYAAGNEVFAFIPEDVLDRLKEFASPDTHMHMLDGSCNLLRAQTKTGGYFDKTLVLGERRGGTWYWALDITKPDPAEWTVKWHVKGKTGAFKELGQTWNRPSFSRIRVSTGFAADDFKDVVIFAGGYDPLEDGFPEEFLDGNENGKQDGSPAPGEAYTDTPGGIAGVYDAWNPGSDTMGRGIFVVDAADGKVVFKATYGSVDLTTGTEQTYADMKYCFPADPSVIPLSKEKLLLYAADIYGQVWKITYDYYDPSSVARWKVKLIFRSNPGSDLASGDPNIAGAQENSIDQGRKVFYSPDLSFDGTCWTQRPVLYFGTGDRAHPRYTIISNRFYAVADYDSLTRETDLLNLTCNELDDQADADGDGILELVPPDDDDALRKDSLKAILKNLVPGSPCRGFYRVLDKQGNCPDETVSHEGEQVLSQPTLFFRNAYFTSYQPVFGDPCNPTGNAFIYALNYCWGTSVFDFSDENSTDRDIRDTYQIIEGGSIPSGVRVITRGGRAAGIISAGGTVSGVGKYQGTNIPGPPAGLYHLLWRIR
jgi:type IV pilus assembly protein PilY1